jgi:hypothetical protein
MDENTRSGDATNEHALDATESWGQGTDTSHPDPVEDTLPNELGADPALSGDPVTEEVDDPPLT